MKEIFAIFLLKNFSLQLPSGPLEEEDPSAAASAAEDVPEAEPASASVSASEAAAGAATSSSAALSSEEQTSRSAASAASAPPSMVTKAEEKSKEKVPGHSPGAAGADAAPKSSTEKSKPVEDVAEGAAVKNVRYYLLSLKLELDFFPSKTTLFF